MARLKSTRFHVLDSHFIMRTIIYTLYPRISYINSLELWVEIHLTRRENAYCIRIHLFDLLTEEPNYWYLNKIIGLIFMNRTLDTNL